MSNADAAPQTREQLTDLLNTARPINCMCSACNEVMPDNTSAFHLLLTGNPTLYSIVGLSLTVSLTAAVLASLLGMPLGALVALT